MDRRPPLPRLAVAVAALAVALGPAALTGCGTQQGRTALAITSARRTAGRVVLRVECADQLTVERGRDASGSDLVQVTVWGRPRVGRCRPALVLRGLPGDAFVDGTTSQVVHITR